MSTAPARANLPLSRVDWISDLIRLEIVLWERIDACLRERHGLPLSFFESLYFISHAPEASLRVGELARALRVTVGGTSKLVDRIQAAGLIARTPDPHDRRAARVTLTPEGKRTVAAAATTYEEAVAALVDPVLDPTEQQQMHRYVKRLLAAAPATDLR
jgi:DNA-binding MarR family transcriptional regulator